MYLLIASFYVVISLCVPGRTLFWYNLFRATQSGWVALDKQEVSLGLLASLPFASLFGKLVACSWEVVVLCHPFDRSLLSLVFPPLACLP